MQIILPHGCRHIPLHHTPDPLRLLQPHTGNKSNVSQGCASETGYDGPAGLICFICLRTVISQISLRQQSELFHIVFRIQLFFVNGVLTLDGINKIASFGHHGTGGIAFISSGIHINISLSIGSKIHRFRHQHQLSPRCCLFTHTGYIQIENIFRTSYTDTVHPDLFSQFRIYFP